MSDDEARLGELARVILAGGCLKMTIEDRVGVQRFGMKWKGPSDFSAADLKAFVEGLDRAIAEILKPNED